MDTARTTIRLNKSKFSPGLQLLINSSRRMPAELLNRALYHTANRARKAMPVVTAAQIEAEMNAVGFVRNPDDKNWRKTNQEQRHLTAAERIVLARMHPKSRYNQRTGGVYRLDKPIFSSPSPGGGGTLTGRGRYQLGAQNRLRFWAWVEERASIMTKARKSSSGFYKFCAHVVSFVFREGTNMTVSADGEALAGSGKVSRAIGKEAGGKPARGIGKVFASFWVRDTEPSTKGGARGIQRVAEPVWQRALDAEAASMTAEAEKRFADLAKKSGFAVR